MKAIRGTKVVKALLEGKKVRHWNETEDEYIYYKKGYVYDKYNTEVKLDLNIFLFSIDESDWYIVG